jgi:hypothetical protein
MILWLVAILARTVVTTCDRLNSLDWMHPSSDPRGPVPWSPKWTEPTKNMTGYFESLMAVQIIRTSLAFTERRRFNIGATKVSSIPIASSWLKTCCNILSYMQYSTSSRPVLGLIQPPIQWVPGALSPGLKRQGVMLTTPLQLVPR